MRRTISLGFVVSLLTGCAVFSSSATSSLPEATPVSADELRSLTPGQWYRVTYPDERGSGMRTQREQIGKLERSDGNSILLTEVTTRFSREATSPLKRVPYINRLYKNTGVGIEAESKPWRIGRELIQSITPISAAEAAEWKQPFERIGIDFDFAGAPNDEGRTVVMSHEKR